MLALAVATKRSLGFCDLKSLHVPVEICIASALEYLWPINLTQRTKYLSVYQVLSFTMIIKENTSKLHYFLNIIMQTNSGAKLKCLTLQILTEDA